MCTFYTNDLQINKVFNQIYCMIGIKHHFHIKKLKNCLMGNTGIIILSLHVKNSHCKDRKVYLIFENLLSKKSKINLAKDIELYRHFRAVKVTHTILFSKKDGQQSLDASYFFFF